MYRNTIDLKHGNQDNGRGVPGAFAASLSNPKVSAGRGPDGKRRGAGTAAISIAAGDSGSGPEARGEHPNARRAVVTQASQHRGAGGPAGSPRIGETHAGNA